jgi:hypothetical protein
MITVDIKFKQEDITKLINNLQSIGKSIQTNSGEFLTEIAENIMAESKNEVPVDTGTLKSTAYITKPMYSNDGSTVVKMGYGGLNDKLNPKPDRKTGKLKMASEYALAVHEIKKYHHPIGKWKFLEDPLRRQTRQFTSILGVRIRALLQRGATLKNV